MSYFLMISVESFLHSKNCYFSSFILTIAFEFWDEFQIQNSSQVSKAAVLFCGTSFSVLWNVDVIITDYVICKASNSQIYVQQYLFTSNNVLTKYTSQIGYSNY